MNYYNDIWFWRASDHAAVARHIRDRPHANSNTDETPRPGLIRSFLLPLLRVMGLAKQPVEARAAEELPERQDCACGDGEFGYREPVLEDGEWALRCPECGHLDRLEWLSDEARLLVLGLARRRSLLLRRKAAKA
ncbi:MAG: hypothetical protein H0V21_05075 [Rubrobacter sp.]|nr:hypothetical protein [Rubrobacter sp.]